MARWRDGGMAGLPGRRMFPSFPRHTSVPHQHRSLGDVCRCVVWKYAGCCVQCAVCSLQCAVHAHHHTSCRSRRCSQHPHGLPPSTDTFSIPPGPPSLPYPSSTSAPPSFQSHPPCRPPPNPHLKLSNILADGCDHSSQLVTGHARVVGPALQCGVLTVECSCVSLDTGSPSVCSKFSLY